MADKKVSLEVDVEVKGGESVDQLEKKIKELEAQLANGKGSKKFDTLNKELNVTKKKLDSVKKSAGTTKGAFDKATKSTSTFTKGIAGLGDTMTGGLISKGSQLKGTLGSIATGFRGIGAAIAASGIGLLVLIIAGVIAAFKKSEEGQNKYAELMHRIGTVVGTLTDLLADLGMFIINLFSGDGEAMTKLKQFGKDLYDVIGLPIKNAIDVVKALGKAFAALFDGDFSGALDELGQGIKEVGKNFSEAKGVIDKTTDAVKKLADEIEREDAISKKISARRAKADKVDRALIVARARANRDIANLRADAEDKEKYSAQERIKFLEEAAEIEENVTKREIAAAQLRASAAAAELELDKSNKAALDAEANARAKVITLQTKQLTIQRALTAKKQALLAEAKAQRLAEEKEGQDALDEFIRIEEERIDVDIALTNKHKEVIEKIQSDHVKKLQDMDAETEVQKLELEQKRVLSELDRLQATEQQKLEVKKYYAQQIADAEITQEKEIAEAKAQINRDLFNTAIQLSEEAFDKETKMGKAAFEISKGLRVAQAIGATYAAANNAMESGSKINPTYGIISAGVAIATGLLNVKKILSTKIGSSTSGGGTPTTTASETQAQPRQSGFTDLRDRKITVDPIKVYVLESDITTKQTDVANTKKVSVIK